MDTFNGNHFSLNFDLIYLVLNPHIEASIRYKIKDCITSVHQVYGCTITKRKTFLRRKRAFEIIYGNWDKSFAALPMYMAVLQHFNLGTVVEWKLERSPGIPEYIFRYVLWAFKLVIDGFVHYRPVISIDDTHVYGKYDIKLLIVVVVDDNGNIFPLAFAICANESQEMWILFLNHLKEHVVKQDSDQQEYKFRRRMELIRQEDTKVYCWLMRHELDKWTLHADGGRRWGILTTNMSGSFNGLLKCARGLPVMVRMSFKQIAERYKKEHVYGTKWMLVILFMRVNVAYVPKQDTITVNVLQLVWEAVVIHHQVEVHPMCQIIKDKRRVLLE
ncbi:uncharacterized protein [Nicotiana tomentosiformis]|uniref:uncharacterized protein n=1 Tax=Nicotiana tomentosiformis TaxID=4098 RepID=UPI00388C46DC